MTFEERIINQLGVMSFQILTLIQQKEDVEATLAKVIKQKEENEKEVGTDG